MPTKKADNVQVKKEEPQAPKEMDKESAVIEGIKKESPKPKQAQDNVEKTGIEMAKEESVSKSDSDDNSANVCTAKSETSQKCIDNSEVSSNNTVRNANSVIDLSKENSNLPVDTDKAELEMKEKREDTAETENMKQEEKIAPKEKETSPEVSSSSSSEWEISESERKSV